MLDLHLGGSATNGAILPSIYQTKSCMYWGVSDHHKANPEPINYWKHYCALMDHNIFMKQKGSIVVLLKQSGIFFWEIFIFLLLFGVFSCLKTFYWIFINKNFFVTQILKCSTVFNYHVWQVQKNLSKKSWEERI